MAQYIRELFKVWYVKNLLKKKRVDFLVVGVQKAGTSALAEYLNSHSTIQMARKKEVHFFNKEKFFRNGRPNYKKYHKYFNWNDRSKKFGEVTPIYFYWPNACQRIWEYNSKMKIVAVLRNPIHRAHSHWGMQKQRGRESLDFGTCIRNERQRVVAELPYQSVQFSYVDRGYYGEQIRRFQRYFPDDQLLFIKYEEFRANQVENLKKIFKFIGVSAKDFDYSFKEKRKTKFKTKISDKDSEYLRDCYRGDILSLEHLLGWDCSDWLKK